MKAAAFLAMLAVAAPALAAEPVAIELVIHDHRFEPAELRVPAQRAILIHVRNLDATAEEFDSTALRVEKVFAGNGEGTVRLHPLDPGRYGFMGEYHAETAQGVVIAE